MSDDLETRIGTVASEAARSVRVDPSALLQGVQTRQRARRVHARRVAVLAAATASVLVAVGATALVPHHRAAKGPTPAKDAVPAGMQAVSWHGVEVLVPSSWRIGDQRCGTPESNTVLVPGFRLDCGRRAVPGLTIVSFFALSADTRAAASQLAAAAITSGTLSGVPVLRGSIPRSDGPGVQRVLVVPSEQVVLTVASPRAAEADSILARARVVAVDAAGCRSREDATTPVGPPHRDGADRSLLPGHPTGASLCRYSDHRLEASLQLTASEVAALQRRLDALPTGRSGRIPPKEITSDYCTELDRDVDVLDANYPYGPGLQVFFRGRACTDRSVLNGSSGRRTVPAVMATLQQLLAHAPVADDLDRTPDRPQPAPELGYAQLAVSPGVGRQRADVLAGSDAGPAGPRLLGGIYGSRLCLLLLLPGRPPATQDCAPLDLEQASVVAYDAGPAGRDRIVAVSVRFDVRSVRLLRAGRELAVWHTWGGGSRYAQRRFAIGTVFATPGTMTVVGLDAAGNEVGRTPL